jgi:flagellar biogenesis protein FliO
MDGIGVSGVFASAFGNVRAGSGGLGPLFKAGCWRRIAWGAAATFLVSCCSAAEPANPTAAVVPSAFPDTGFSVLRLFGALSLVIGLFFGGIWLARNWQRIVARQVRAPELRVLEVKSLGGRQALWIVGYRQQRQLLASSPAGVTLLTELPLAPADEGAPAAAVDFAEAFKQVLGRS